ncbi:UNVERIFIED_CONTAM: hypothetical protein Scaly_2004800 [Sesamum calycinum]
MIPKPRREPLQPVLPEPHSGHGVRAVGARDDESEHEEHQQQNYEDKHANQVDPQKAFLFPVGADESGEGDNEESYTEEDEGPTEPVDALVVRLGGQPYTGGDYGDGAHKSNEVEDGCDVVADCHDQCVETGEYGVGF